MSGNAAGDLTTKGNLAYTGMSTVEGAGNSTLNSVGDTFVISGAQAGNLTTKVVAFTGMSTLAGGGNGTLNSAGDTWVVSASRAGNLTTVGNTAFTGMSSLKDTGGNGTLNSAADT